MLPSAMPASADAYAAAPIANATAGRHDAS